MLLPNGLPLYERLDTRFTRLPELLRTLRESRFHGYVEVRFPKHQCALFCIDGDAIAVLEDKDGQRRAGLELLPAITAQTSTQTGEIRVVELTRELVRLCAAQSQSRAVHSGLSTEYTRLDRLLATLSREHHTGHVELHFETGASALVFFDQGEPVDLVSDLPEAEGASNVLERVIAAADRLPGTISVYRHETAPAGRAPAPVPVPAPAPAAPMPMPAETPRLLAALQEVLAELEAAVDAVAGGGAFERALRRAQQECSQAHPFLDPFEGLFEYRAGRVTFEGPEGTPVLLAGVRECLRSALGALTRDAGAAKRLRGRLSGLAPRIHALPPEFAAAGFESLLPVLTDAAAAPVRGRVPGGNGTG